MKRRKKIYFRHGTMFSGKTLNLISVIKTYKEDNCNILILKHSKDTRDTKIKSRNSDEEIECIVFDDNDNLRIVIDRAINERSKILGYNYKPDIIVIDEIQFCSISHIIQLDDVSKIAPIMCYGLKTSYTGELFPAIAKLLTIAEDVQEIKTVCSMCAKKATHNLLVRNGIPTYSGELINVEGENNKDVYFKVCRQHFYNPDLVKTRRNTWDILTQLKK